MSRLQAVAGVLKERFPNLTVMEVIDLSEKVISAYARAKEAEYIAAYTPAPRIPQSDEGNGPGGGTSGNHP